MTWRVVASAMNPENDFFVLSSYIFSRFNSQGNVGQEKTPKKHTTKTALLNIVSLRNLLNVIQREEMFVVETKLLHLSTIYKRLSEVNIYYSFQKQLVPRLSNVRGHYLFRKANSFPARA